MIALLCATPREMSRLASLMEDAGEKDSPRGTLLIEGSICKTDVLIMAGGVGKVAAASGTRFLLDNFPLSALINYGIAGALSPRVVTGDVIIATELIHGDVGVAHSRGFKPTGPGLCEEGQVIFSPLCAVAQPLVERSKAAADKAGIPYHAGKILTCDQVILDPELRAHLGQRFDALAVEMEGAAAAQVALGDDLPFIAARAISDELDHDLIGLEKVLPYKGQSRRHLWGKRFILSVTHPSAIIRARELSRGIDTALDNISSFLQSLLKAGLGNSIHSQGSP